MKLSLLVLIQSILMLPLPAISADFPAKTPVTQWKGTLSHQLDIQTRAAQGSFARKHTLTRNSFAQTLGALVGASAIGSWADLLFAQAETVEQGGSQGQMPPHISARSMTLTSNQRFVFPSEKFSIEPVNGIEVYSVTGNQLVLDLKYGNKYSSVRVNSTDSLKAAVNQWGWENAHFVIEYTVPSAERFDTLVVRLIPERLATQIPIYRFLAVFLEGTEKAKKFVHKLAESQYIEKIRYIKSKEGNKKSQLYVPVRQFSGFDEEFRIMAKAEFNVTDKELGRIEKELTLRRRGPMVVFTDLMKYPEGGQLVMPLHLMLDASINVQNKEHQYGWGIFPEDLNQSMYLDLFFGWGVRPDRSKQPKDWRPNATGAKIHIRNIYFTGHSAANSAPAPAAVNQSDLVRFSALHQPY